MHARKHLPNPPLTFTEKRDIGRVMMETRSARDDVLCSILRRGELSLYIALPPLIPSTDYRSQG